jgi:hypothetical protein
LKNPSQKRPGGVASRCKPQFKPQSKKGKKRKGGKEERKEGRKEGQLKTASNFEELSLVLFFMKSSLTTSMPTMSFL